MKTKILTGDVRQVLTRQPSASFDAVLCDPPYGLSFMGKAWDHGVPGSEVWAEVLRVLKPGAPLMAFGGTRTFHRLACAIEDAGFLIADTICWIQGQGFPKGKSQLKPAWEPITVAWKKGTRSPLAIDASRIEAAGRPRRLITCTRNGTAGNVYDGGTGGSGALNGSKADGLTDTGRWPANVILDAEAGELLDQQSGHLVSGNNPSRRSADKHRGVYAGWKGEQCLVHRGTDSGGASRFFYCAKASKSERGEGNTHPTVKPIKLIEYLAKLILPPERDTPRRLLIPFSGSGSEMLGSRKAGWDEITGIEISPEYAAIAASRLKAA